MERVPFFGLFYRKAGLSFVQSAASFGTARACEITRRAGGRSSFKASAIQRNRCLYRFSEIRSLLAAVETGCWMPGRRTADGRIITAPTRE